ERCRVSAETASHRPPPREAKTKGPLLLVEGLSKLFPLRAGLFDKPRFVHAVDGVSLVVRKGETLGLVGESGSGKTTLGPALLRPIEPTVGRVVFDGIDVTGLAGDDLRSIRRRMQVIFQDPYASLNPRMTVREIVGEGISIFDLAPSEREATAMVVTVLEKV